LVLTFPRLQPLLVARPMETLILVDEKDTEIGYEDKERCHLIPTQLHRAFSIFIINKAGSMLVHKRSFAKKTWPGYWTNACCSHPRRGENLEGATQRRLLEEMGFQCPLEHLFSFSYRASYDARYGEYEFDHVFLGTYEGQVKTNPDEVEDWRYISIDELRGHVKSYPGAYTPWFRRALPRVLRHIANRSPGGRERKGDA
jgi:isopentenyl-diphosphate Delta-isomerase